MIALVRFGFGPESGTALDSKALTIISNKQLELLLLLSFDVCSTYTLNVLDLVAGYINMPDWGKPFRLGAQGEPCSDIICKRLIVLYNISQL